MAISPDLSKLISSFKWESEAQEKGVLALVKYLRDVAKKSNNENLSIDQITLLICAWFIQKDYESSCWFIDRIENQTDPFQKKVNYLELEVSALKEQVEQLLGSLPKSKRLKLGH
jgi:hypothetical protein